MRAPRGAGASLSVSLAASLVPTAIGVITLVGWIVGVDALKGLGGAITMKANTATALIACGASLAVSVRMPRWRAVAGALAMIAGAIGVVTLLEHVFGWNLAIDELLFKEAVGAAATASPGRMGPNACVSLALMSVALLSLHRDTPTSISRAQLCAVGVMVLAMSALTGYWYGARELFDLAQITGIAFPTSCAFFALSVGILAARPDSGPVAVFVGDRPGSVMARRLVPAAVALPLVLGYLRAEGQEAGLYDTGFGTAMFGIALVLTFVAIIWRTAGQVNDLDAERAHAEAGMRASDESFATLFRSLPAGVVLTRSDGTFVDVNDAYTSLTGYTREELIGRRADQMGLAAGFTRGAAELQRHTPSGEPIRKAELRVVQKNGETCDVLAHVSVILFQGAPHLLSTVADITERKKAEEAAESANRLKDQFLATLSHELRAPLNAILGYARMLRNDTIAPHKRARAIEVIERNAVAQTQLVEDLLDVSRVTTGRLKVEVRPVSVAVPLREALETIRPAADAKGLVIDVGLDTSFDTVRGDSHRLRQVFWNLASNAVKFTPPGGRLRVTLERDEATVVVTVSDTGIGIAPDFLAHVFEPFRQADSRTSREYSGLGLGLAICKQLVELHGGAMSVESDGVGFGATFTVRLPSCVDSPEGVDSLRSRVRVAPLADPIDAAAAQLDGINVLLVDDETDSLELMQDILEGSGATVRIAASAATALREWGNRAPDLLVSDIALPGTDGYELLRRLRARSGSIFVPALAVTAHAFGDDRARAFAAGFQGHIAKPIDPAAFVAAAVSVLHAHA